MIYEEAPLNALKDLGSTPFAATVYRFAFADRPPLRPNFRGARWNPPDVAALYTTLDQETAHAEIEYLTSAQPIRPRPAVVLARIDAHLERVVDLDPPVLSERFGVDLAALTEGIAGYPPCQRIGGAAAFISRSGILVPSLRKASARNLVIFTANLIPEVEHLEVVVE